MAEVCETDPLEMKHLICKNVDQLKYDDQKVLFKWIVIQIGLTRVDVHSDGSSINLDNLNDNIITLIYNKVQSLLET